MSNKEIIREKNFVSAVVYVRNQESEIGIFLETVDHVLQTYFEKYEIICVNDASTDHSCEGVREYAKESRGNAITVLNMSFYQGLEISMNAGVDFAIGDFVFEFDSANVTYPAELIMKVYERALSGFDIVAACPQKCGHRLSEFFYKVYNAASSTQYPLRTEAFRILSRRAINRVHGMSKTMPYRKAVYANCGLKSGCVMFDLESSLPKAKGIEYENQKVTGVDALMLYTNLAYRFSMSLSVLMMMITVFMAGYTVIIYMTGKPVEGWTTTILFLAFSFFGIFTMLTISVRYLCLLLKVVFNNQKYLVESVEKLK